MKCYICVCFVKVYPSVDTSKEPCWLPTSDMTNQFSLWNRFYHDLYTKFFTKRVVLGSWLLIIITTTNVSPFLRSDNININAVDLSFGVLTPNQPAMHYKYQYSVWNTTCVSKFCIFSYDVIKHHYPLHVLCYHLTLSSNKVSCLLTFCSVHSDSTD